ncbi:MAG: hypothetical protein ACW987_18090 [Candidatus Thorarchaeota archaeon]|jgi:hypothetical protein
MNEEKAKTLGDLRRGLEGLSDDYELVFISTDSNSCFVLDTVIPTKTPEEGILVRIKQV